MTLDCTKINLKQNDTGDQVLELQKGLKQLGYYTSVNGHYLKLDGIFGQYTTAAVKKFQRDTGHTPDGVFGPKTCPDFNKKLGIKDTPEQTEKKEDKKADNQKVETEKDTEIIIDAKKYNVIPASMANLTVEGIHLIAESVSEKDTLGRETQWVHNTMMNGNILFSAGTPVVSTIEVTFHLHFDQYKKLINALTLIQNKKQCKVITELFDSGRYFITFTKTYDSIDEFKVTMKLMKSLRALED